MRPGSLPLAKVFQIKGVCEDCGWRTVKGRWEIATEQLRHQIATPEELGSLITCPGCVGRGGEGKNISIRVIDATGLSMPIRIDRRPLSAIDRVTAGCRHCGFHFVLEREQLDEMPDVQNVDHLARAAYCMTCKEAGSPNPALTIEVSPPMPEPGTSPKPRWSKATVFGDNRSDPWPDLPRRRIGR